MSQAISKLNTPIRAARQTAVPIGSARPHIARRVVDLAWGPAKWFIGRYWGVIVIVGGWHTYITVLDINRMVMPSPSSVFVELTTNPGRYVEPSVSTLTVAIFGLVGGMTMGATFASLSWFARALNGLLTPVAVILRSVPIVAMVPVLARVFGYEQRTILLITIAISFFPTFVFVSSGLRSTPAGSDDLFAVLGARRITLFTRLAFPSAVPNALVAFRLSAADCILAALVAEFLMGTRGLGHVFQDTIGDLDMLTAWTAAIIATIFSVTLFLLTRRLERAGQRRWSI
ncbi:MAG: ABC-type nitrate/sulfonate/bicarbonate transport system permease component [Candidatus Aldehydirespiratoraceae bacterium]|jgi:ABC-type nitrate/sulfonate/bicarbonate transport system permease component